MMTLAETIGFVMGAGGLGYAASWVFYIFRRAVWSIT